MESEIADHVWELCGTAGNRIFQPGRFRFANDPRLGSMEDMAWSLHKFKSAFTAKMLHREPVHMERFEPGEQFYVDLLEDPAAAGHVVFFRQRDYIAKGRPEFITTWESLLQNAHPEPCPHLNSEPLEVTSRRCLDCNQEYQVEALDGGSI